MNIVDAYIKFKGQLVILISGMSGSGISRLAKMIGNDFNIEEVSLDSFIDKNNAKKITLPDGTEIINWDSDDIINWKLFNDTINQKKKKGIVVYGQSFPSDKIDAEIDMHIHIKLSKQNLMEKRQKFVEKHKDTFPHHHTHDQFLYIFNKYTFPYYLTTVENAKINKFINANNYINHESYYQKLYDDSFDFIIDRIQKWIDKYNESLPNNEESDEDDDEQYLFNSQNVINSMI